MYRHISLLQLSRYLSQSQGHPVVAADCVALAEELIARHAACLPFGKSALDCTDDCISLRLTIVIILLFTGDR